MSTSRPLDYKLVENTSDRPRESGNAARPVRLSMMPVLIAARAFGLPAIRLLSLPGRMPAIAGESAALIEELPPNMGVFRAPGRERDSSLA